MSTQKTTHYSENIAQAASTHSLKVNTSSELLLAIKVRKFLYFRHEILHEVKNLLKKIDKQSRSMFLVQTANGVSFVWKHRC